MRCWRWSTLLLFTFPKSRADETHGPVLFQYGATYTHCRFRSLSRCWSHFHFHSCYPFKLAASDCELALYVHIHRIIGVCLNMCQCQSFCALNFAFAFDTANYESSKRGEKWNFPTLWVWLSLSLIAVVHKYKDENVQEAKKKKHTKNGMIKEQMRA